MFHTEKKSAVTRANALRKPGRSKLRARVAAAFTKFANAVDVQTANSRTHAFYRSSGTDWTHVLKSIGGAND